VSRAIRSGLAAVVLILTAACLGSAPAPAQTAAMAGKLDLNAATLEQVLALPVPAEVARAIVEYRDFVSYFGSVYELNEVPGMTPALLASLKPLVATLPPPPPDQAIQRLTASYRQARNFLGQEGANEGLADEYLDLLLRPVDINDLDLYDLLSFQNVSPVDATNILTARGRLGRFETDRQLRNAGGVSYWAYRNLRDFVVYDPAARGLSDRVQGRYSLRYSDAPLLNNVSDDEGTVSLVTQLRGVDPAISHKLTLELPHEMSAGVATHRNVAEPTWRETTKAFLGIENRNLGPLHLKHLYAGNYRLAFGQGVVMDNTDFVFLRKTGFGWNKRPLGVHADLSRSREAALTGGALEASAGPVNFSAFASHEMRDAILNDDDPDPSDGRDDRTVNHLVTMAPRLSDAFLDEHYLRDGLTPTGITRDAVRENLVGGNVKVLLAPGTYVGFTGYESRYDRGFKPDSSLVMGGNLGLLTPRDAELFAAYRSVFPDPAAGVRRAYKFRTVLGPEFQAVWRNVSVQGEYAWLQDPRASVLHGNNPDAWVVNAYAQFDDLNLLAIYRDYDIGFDNPYQRSFSNNTRYEQTLLDAPYRLEDDLYSWLVSEGAQPKAERGLFLDLRYRLSRTLTITGLQYDNWERKADGADLTRYTLKAEYQPIFNLRFRVRQRFSSRTELAPEDVRTYKSWETRLNLLVFLSDYNRLQFMYVTTNVNFPARQRLSYPAEPGSGASNVGTAADPGHAFEVRYEHNLTPWLLVQGAACMYDGFLWNFEGNEFVMVNGPATRTWLGIESRLSDRLLAQLKVTRDHKLPRYVDLRQYGGPVGGDPDASFVPHDDLLVRLQMDYSF
jgi:DNA uptake protein ComE-like DNA-binding protein